MNFNFHYNLKTNKECVNGMKGNHASIIFSNDVLPWQDFQKTSKEFIMQAVFLLSVLSFNFESSQDIQERVAIPFRKPLLKDI